MSREGREVNRLLKELIRLLVDLLDYLHERDFATTATLGVDQMATTLTLTFQDANGNPAAPPKGDGSGLEVVFSSDNPNVTVGTATASGDTATAPITGTEAFNASAVVSNTSGAPLLDDDGVTAFVQPGSLAVAAVPPPQAVTAVLSAT